jgi:hypothetical protein
MAVVLCGKFCPVSLGIFVTVVITSEVSTNKINPLSQAAPSPPVPIHSCLSSHVAALDPSEVVVDLRVVPTDRIPFWVDLVPAAAFHILPALVASSALSDSSRPLASSPPQQPLALVPSSTATRLSSWCWFDSSTSPWDPGSSLFFYL